MKFAAAYGFRNIQNVVQKLKRKRCNYHYIEVMACPSGCLNGGGQIKFDEDKSSAASQLLTKEYLQRVETVYKSLRLVSVYSLRVSVHVHTTCICRPVAQILCLYVFICISIILLDLENHQKTPN